MFIFCLKSMKEIYKITWNLIQNQAVIGKVFKFDWFKKEDFLSDDSFLYKFIKEVPEWLGWNFFSVWKKNKWFELEIMFENFYFRVKKWLKDTYDISDEELQKFEQYYQTWKENIKGVIDNSLAEENYFASFLPTLVWFENNVRANARLRNKRTAFMGQLNNFNYKYFFWDNIKPVRNIPVFPYANWSNEIFQEKDFNFDSETNQIFDKFIKDIYNETINVVVREKSKSINKNSKDLQKEVYIFFKSLVPNVYQIWEEIFYDSSQLQYRAFADSYFYPSSWYYLKMFDINFLTNFISNEIITKSDSEILKKILRNAVKNWVIDYFVIKSSIIKDKLKLSLNFDKVKNRYTYKWTNRTYLISPSNKEERKMILNVWEHFNTRWRYWITVGIYAKEKDNLFYVIRDIINAYKKENIKIAIEWFEKENWFNYNNYLSIWLSENLQISNFNGLYSYLFNDRVSEIKPCMYWGTDLTTNTPLFLDPFSDFVKGNRHILLVWDSWAGKSTIAQQMISTILSEKVIAIDPAGTFSNISNIWFPIPKIDIQKDMDNPIYIDADADLYQKMWDNLDYESFYKEKVDMIIKILQIKYLETDYQLRKYVNNIFILLYKKHKWKITLNILYKDLEEIFDYLQNNKQNQLDIWKKIFDTVSTERWINKIWEIMGAIDNLEGSNIYKILNKEKDFLNQIWKLPKMIFKVDWLNLSKLKSEAKLAEQNKIPLQWDALIRILHFEMLLDWISQFFLINKDYMDNVLELNYDKKLKTYLFIDEVHNLLDVSHFKPILDNFIREIRNRYASAFLLTQNITDFPNSMLKNIMVKMFLTAKDVEDYFTKFVWIDKEENTSDESKYDKEDETNQVKILKLYRREYEKALDNHRGVESLWFYHYWNQVFLTRNILSDYMLKNIEKLKT